MRIGKQERIALRHKQALKRLAYVKMEIARAVCGGGQPVMTKATQVYGKPSNKWGWDFRLHLSALKKGR